MSSVAAVEEDKNTKPKFEMRAAPRRRVAKGEDNHDVPGFLKKAYQMITKCPDHIGGWSPDGDTVLVKDVDVFSSTIIPTAFKHNNFSSFVRQLNFYGFRKIKTELSEKEMWWEFHHPKFQRGQEKLLIEIKRSDHINESNSNNSEEVYELKNEVSTLNERVDDLTQKLAQLSNLVNTLTNNGVVKPNAVTATSSMPNNTRSPSSPVPIVASTISVSYSEGLTSKKRKLGSDLISSNSNSYTISSSSIPVSDDSVTDDFAEEFDWNDLENLLESESTYYNDMVSSSSSSSSSFTSTSFARSSIAQQEDEVQKQEFMLPPPPMKTPRANSFTGVDSSASSSCEAVREASNSSPCSKARFLATMQKLFTPEAMTTLTEKFNEISSKECPCSPSTSHGQHPIEKEAVEENDPGNGPMDREKAKGQENEKDNGAAAGAAVTALTSIASRSNGSQKQIGEPAQPDSTNNTRCESPVDATIECAYKHLTVDLSNAPNANVLKLQQSMPMIYACMYTMCSMVTQGCPLSEQEVQA